MSMSDSDHRSAEVREQAQRHAEQARMAMEKRREGAGGGLSGWVAERAGEWDLAGQDETTMQRQKFFWNLLVDYWFRMEIDGWENIGESPVLLIGIHSGAPFVWDAWTVGLQWWRRFGSGRPLPRAIVCANDLAAVGALQRTGPPRRGGARVGRCDRLRRHPGRAAAPAGRVPAEETAPEWCEPDSATISTTTSTTNATTAPSRRRRKRALSSVVAGGAAEGPGLAAGARLRAVRCSSSKSQFQRGLMRGC